MRSVFLWYNSAVIVFLSYIQVLVPQLEGLMGRMAYVKIISSGKHFMMGEIIDLIERHKKKKDKVEGNLSSSSHSVVGPFRTSNMLLLVILIITGLIIVYRLPHLATVLNKLYLI